MARTKEPARRRTLMNTRPVPFSLRKPEVVITQPPPHASSGQPRVKIEPAEHAALLRASKLTITIKPRAPVVLQDVDQPWKHPDELEYIRPYDWSEDQIISFLCKNGFSVPPRPTHSMDPWTKITGADGTTTVVPRGYRTPLMFAAKFQWESLRLVMTSADRDEEWEDYKFDILHVSRLCARFLEEARQAMVKAGMDRTWRCPMFDRVLTRYYRRWLVNREEFLKDFWAEFKEEEYERDVLKNDWTRFVLKGHKGFSLTKQDIQKGFTFEDLTYGLGFIGGRMNWITPGPDASSRSTSLSSKPEPLKVPSLPISDLTKAPAMPLSCETSTTTTTTIAPAPLSAIPPPSQTPMPPHPQTRKDDTCSNASASTSSLPKAAPPRTVAPTRSSTTSGKSSALSETLKETNTESIERLKKMAGIAKAMVVSAASVSPAPSSPATTAVGLNRTEIGKAPVDENARSLQVKCEIEIMSGASTDLQRNAQGPVSALPPTQTRAPWTWPAEWDSPSPLSEAESLLGTGEVDQPTDQSSDAEMGSLDATSESDDGAMEDDDGSRESDDGSTDGTAHPSSPLSPAPPLSPPPPPPPVPIDARVPSPLSPHATPHPNGNGNVNQPSPSPTKEKGRSNWDARVSAALERARLMAGARVGDERGTTGGSVHGVNGIGASGSNGSKIVSADGISSLPASLPSSSSSSSTTTAPTSTSGPSVPDKTPTSAPQESHLTMSAPQPQQEPDPSDQEQDSQYKLRTAAWSSSTPSTEIEMGTISYGSTSQSSLNGGGPLSQPPQRLAPPPPPPSSSLSLRYPGISGRRRSAIGVGPNRRSTISFGASGRESARLGRSPVVKKIVSIFRNTLEGLTDILDDVGREDQDMNMDIDADADEDRDGDEDEDEQESSATAFVNSRPLKRKRTSMSSSGQRHSSFVPPVASTSSAQPVPQPDTSLVGELLGEIKALQQRLKEDAERRVDHDAEVVRIQGEVEDLKRHVARLDREHDADGISIDGELKTQRLFQPNSPRTWGASVSSPIHHGPTDLSFSTSQSPHPLSHILALDMEAAPSPVTLRPLQDSSTPIQISRGIERESTSVSIASTSEAVFLSTPERSIGFDSAPVKHRRSGPVRSTSPCPETEMTSDRAKAKAKDDSRDRERRESMQHDDVPLPVRSQRKHRMMFVPRSPTQ